MLNLPKVLKSRYVVGLLLIAALVVTNYVVVLVHLDKNKYESHIINMAGRQRMLSQRVVKDILIISNAESDVVAAKENLETSLRVWSRNHNGLKDRTVGLFEGSNPIQVQVLFEAIEQSFSSLEGSVRCFLGKVAACKFSMTKVLSAEAEYLRLMDQIVDAYSENLANEFAWQKMIETVLVVLTLLFLLIEAIFIFEPAVRSVRNSINALTKEKAIAAERFKLMALGEMAGGIAHEINNPLAIIRGRAELMQGQLDKDVYTKEPLETNVKAIMNTVDRIGSIVKGLLKLSREELPSSLQLESARAIVSDAISVCQEKMKLKGIRIELSKVPSDVKVLCHPVELSQVLLNLISNASFPAEQSKEKLIEIEVKQTLVGIDFIVRNSGEKIPKDIQKKIFNPFFTTRNVGSGTGLGLSVSKSLVEKMEANIYLDTKSELTTFVVHFPNKRTSSFSSY